MLEFTDYYRAKKSLDTPTGIIPEGSIGHMSQYGDVIRFEGLSKDDSREIVVTAIAKNVREREDLFEALEIFNGGESGKHARG